MEQTKQKKPYAKPQVRSTPILLPNFFSTAPGCTTPPDC